MQFEVWSVSRFPFNQHQYTSVTARERYYICSKVTVYCQRYRVLFSNCIKFGFFIREQPAVKHDDVCFDQQMNMIIED